MTRARTWLRCQFDGSRLVLLSITGHDIHVLTCPTCDTAEGTSR